MESIVSSLLECCHEGGGYDLEDDESISTLSVVGRKTNYCVVPTRNFTTTSTPLNEIDYDGLNNVERLRVEEENHSILNTSKSTNTTTNSSEGSEGDSSEGDSSDEEEEKEEEQGEKVQEAVVLVNHHDELIENFTSPLETSNLTDDCIIQELWSMEDKEDKDDDEWSDDSDSLLHMTDDEDEYDSSFVYDDEYGVEEKEEECPNVLHQQQDEYGVYKEILSSTANVTTGTCTGSSRRTSEDKDFDGNWEESFSSSFFPSFNQTANDPAVESSSSGFIGSTCTNHHTDIPTAFSSPSPQQAKSIQTTAAQNYHQHQPKREKFVSFMELVEQENLLLRPKNNHNKKQKKDKEKKQRPNGMKKRFGSLLSSRNSKESGLVEPVPTTQEHTTLASITALKIAVVTPPRQKQQVLTMASIKGSSTTKIASILDQTVTTTNGSSTITEKESAATSDMAASTISVEEEEQVAAHVPEPEEDPVDLPAAPPKATTTTSSSSGSRHPRTTRITGKSFPKPIPMDNDDVDDDRSESGNMLSIKQPYSRPNVTSPTTVVDTEQSFGMEDVDPFCFSENHPVPGKQMVDAVHDDDDDVSKLSRQPWERPANDLEMTPKMKNLRKMPEKPKQNGLFSFWENRASANSKPSPSPAKTASAEVVLSKEQEVADENVVQELDTSSFDFSDPDLENLGIPLSEYDWTEWPVSEEGVAFPDEFATA